MKSGFYTQIEESAIISPLSFTCNKQHIIIIPASGYCEKNMHFIIVLTNTVKSHVASNLFVFWFVGLLVFFFIK